MYEHLVLGGTFDHLHSGHTHLLQKATTLSKRITVGITTPPLLEKKQYKAAIENFTVRSLQVQKYFASLGFFSVEIIALDSIFGTTLTDRSIDAILITEQTRANAMHINSLREKRGLVPLSLCMCDLLTDMGGEIISSSRIRAGEIGSDGTVYSSVFSKDLIIGEKAKAILRKPLGICTVQHIPTDSLPVLIGDIVTQSFIDTNKRFSCAIIDGKTQRQPFELSITPFYTLSTTNLFNPPGTIRKAVADYFYGKFYSENTIYRIDGEEDLLACVAVLSLPLNSTVIYGQSSPHSRMVYVEVTPKIKNTIYSLLQMQSHK